MPEKAQKLGLPIIGECEKAYNSKYKEAADSENPRTVEFPEKIEELIENFDELVKAS